MDFSYLFDPYETQIAKGDHAFKRMVNEYPDCVLCEPHCSDCCHAVFGLFLIEAAFLRNDFDQLDDEKKAPALSRAREADKAFERLGRNLELFEDDPQMKVYTMAKARIQCPLLNDQQECILYPYRPITCRVYGIPNMVQGVPRVCGKSGFKKDLRYPVFNLDEIHRELYRLSAELVKSAGGKDPDKAASFMVSVSKVIQTPMDKLIQDIDEGHHTRSEHVPSGGTG